MIKVSPATATALDVPGTPWLVLSRDGWILWESEMQAPAELVSDLLEGMAKSGTG